MKAVRTGAVPSLRHEEQAKQQQQKEQQEQAHDTEAEAAVLPPAIGPSYRVSTGGGSTEWEPDSLQRPRPATASRTAPVLGTYGM